MVAVAATGALAVAAPAAAAEPVTSTSATLCPQGWFCGWPEPDYQGDWGGGDSPNTCYTPMDGSLSVSNQMGHTIRFFSEEGCQGAYFDLETGNGSSWTPFPVHSANTGWY